MVTHYNNQQFGGYLNIAADRQRDLWAIPNLPLIYPTTLDARIGVSVRRAQKQDFNFTRASSRRWADAS